jgi:murein DD-endopeptidase MepM/ murein hydrolase activator NlpD
MANCELKNDEAITEIESGNKLTKEAKALQFDKVQKLLGLKIQPGDSLTVDDKANYFDKIKTIFTLTDPFTPSDSIEQTNLKFICPVKEGARVTDMFGMRQHPVTGKWGLHSGMDFSGRRGDPVYATADGIVMSIITEDQDIKNGNQVYLTHSQGFITRYAHLDSILVFFDQRVACGDRIATIGKTGRTTGPHLHFEIQVNGIPIDPNTFLKF